MNVERQIEYWQFGGLEDIEAARSLLEKRHYRHALFFAELAVEKLLKAHVAQRTRAVPPKTHDLLRLAHLGQVILTEERRRSLAQLQQYCLEGRYPESLPPAPGRGEARIAFGECEKEVSWLTDLLR